jgi:hypothetical protein
LTRNPEDDALDVLACDFRARPRGAPTVFDVLPAVQQVARIPAALTVTFTPTAVALVTAYVAAERLCCADITWDLRREPMLQLQIGAKPGQLDLLEELFTNGDVAAS